MKSPKSTFAPGKLKSPGPEASLSLRKNIRPPALLRDAGGRGARTKGAIRDRSRYDAVLWRGVMRETPTRTRNINRVSGVYRSACHHTERTILEGQRFPRCGRCNSDTVWTFVRSTKSSHPKT